MARALSDTGWHKRYINIPPREKKTHTKKKRNAYTNSCSFESIRENKWPTKNENTLTPAILISCATYTLKRQTKNANSIVYEARTKITLDGTRNPLLSFIQHAMHNDKKSNPTHRLISFYINNTRKKKHRTTPRQREKERS